MRLAAATQRGLRNRSSDSRQCLVDGLQAVRCQGPRRNKLPIRRETLAQVPSRWSAGGQARRPPWWQRCAQGPCV